MVLGAEVAVQRAEGDVGALGDLAHPHGVVPTFGGQLERKPRLAEALIKAAASSEPGVAEAAGDVSTNLRAMLEPLLLDLDHDVRDGLIDLISQVWHSSLMGWTNGRFPIHDVGVKMERAVRLILEPRFDPTTRRVPRVAAAR